MPAAGGRNDPDIIINDTGLMTAVRPGGKGIGSRLVLTDAIVLRTDPQIFIDVLRDGGDIIGSKTIRIAGLVAKGGEGKLPVDPLQAGKSAVGTHPNASLVIFLDGAYDIAGDAIAVVTGIKGLKFPLCRIGEEVEALRATDPKAMLPVLVNAVNITGPFAIDPDPFKGICFWVIQIQAAGCAYPKIVLGIAVKGRDVVGGNGVGIGAIPFIGFEAGTVVAGKADGGTEPQEALLILRNG